jgi:hypothetical protein
MRGSYMKPIVRQGRRDGAMADAPRLLRIGEALDGAPRTRRSRTPTVAVKQGGAEAFGARDIARVACAQVVNE